MANKEVTLDELKEKLSKQSVEQTQSDLERDSSLTTTQKVVALTALQKAVKAKLDDLRHDLTEEMVDQYWTDESDRRVARVGSSKIGTVALRRSTQQYTVTDYLAFEEYLKANNYATVEMCVYENFQKSLFDILLEVVENGNPLKVDDFAFAFYEKVTPTKQFELIVRPVVDVCINKVTGETIAGIKPKREEIVGITVKTEKPLDVISALVTNRSDPLQKMLGGDGDV